jgi:hypothetical protein
MICKSIFKVNNKSGLLRSVIGFELIASFSCLKLLFRWRANANLCNQREASSVRIQSKRRIFCFRIFLLSSTRSSSSDAYLKKNNALTPHKTQRLMRLIYSRVHPDLFTNYQQAQVIRIS